MAGLMLVCMLAVMGPFGQMVSWAANTRIAFSDPSVMAVSYTHLRAHET